MAGLVQIRDVEDDVRQRLKARAAAEGVSLNSYLRELLAREVATPTRAEVLERIAARAERSAVSATEIIRHERDERARWPR